MTDFGVLLLGLPGTVRGDRAVLDTASGTGVLYEGTYQGQAGLFAAEEVNASEFLFFAGVTGVEATLAALRISFL